MKMVNGWGVFGTNKGVIEAILLHDRLCWRVTTVAKTFFCFRDRLTIHAISDLKGMELLVCRRGFPYQSYYNVFVFILCFLRSRVDIASCNLLILIIN